MVATTACPATTPPAPGYDRGVFNRRKSKPGPPDEDAVVERVLCIAAVAMLGAIAAGVEDDAMDEGEAERYLVESRRWLIRESLASALSSDEKALIAKPVTEWSTQERVAATRRSESMGVLLWALSSFAELPAYDASFGRLPSFVPLLAPTAGFRGTARLRSPDELERARSVAELWHWRVRTRELLERDDPQVADHDLDAITRQAAELAFTDGKIPAPIAGDFPAHGKPFRALGADEYEAVTSAVVERHYALNWLAGRSADWDAVPTI